MSLSVCWRLFACASGAEQTHVLDLFGPVFDPIGYRLDLNTYYDKEDIPVNMHVAFVLGVLTTGPCAGSSVQQPEIALLSIITFGRQAHTSNDVQHLAAVGLSLEHCSCFFIGWAHG